MKKIPALLFAVGLISATLSAQKSKVDLQSLETYFDRSRQEWEVPGMAIAIVKDDSLVFAKGFGIRTIGTTDKVNIHTLFAIASLSKAFTTACLGMLVEQGKLDWDDPVTNYVPYFQMFDPYVTREMKVRDLLCHRSGSKTFGGDLIWYGTGYTREEVVKRVRYLKPSYSFRSKYGYQNIMFITAGEIFPAVTGMTWDAYVKEHIFVPLGMKETNTTIRAFEGNTNVATPHTTHNGKLITIPYRNVDNAGCDAAINSNVYDMSRWIKMWLKPDSLANLIRPETRFELWTPQTVLPVSMSSARRFPSTHFRAAALGWFTSDYQGRKIVEHGGGMDGMISKICLVPEERLGFIILTNSISALSTAMQYTILDTYLGATGKDWSKELLKSAMDAQKKDSERERLAEEARKKDTKPSLPLQGYTGKYRSTMYGDVTVTLIKEKLVVTFLPTASFVGDLSHWQYDSFQIELRDPTLPKGFVTFVLDASGTASEMRIDIPNPDFDFTELELKRIPE